MSVVRVGSTSSYAEGWDFVFGSAKVARRSKKTKGRVVAGKAARKAVKKKGEAAPKARTKKARRVKARG